MKKYLSVLLVGLFTSVGAFASADTVDWFTSESQICSVSISNSSSMWVWDLNDSCSDLLWYDHDYLNVCFDVSPDWYFMYDNSSEKISYIWPVCRSELEFWDYGFYFYSDTNGTSQNVSWKFYMSNDFITPPSSSSDNNNSWITIPWISWSSFASGITNWVNAMIWWFGTWIPKLMMYWLPILVVVIFWRKIWSFIKRIFKRR